MLQKLFYVRKPVNTIKFFLISDITFKYRIVLFYKYIELFKTTNYQIIRYNEQVKTLKSAVDDKFK